jgi:isoleucyl-tRNA synthetase
MFKKVDPKVSLPKMEEEILKFWEENKIFEKSVEKNPENKSFIFYEGPPTANGQPGLHHVLARAFKDVIPRYKTMKGYRVERKAGWDTHGLPVELQVEKALGLKNKQDIENIVPGNTRESIIEFNKKCKESVWQYKDLWEKMTRRMAYWVDMKNPYVTYENKYIESVWWVIAQIFKTKNKKGESLIYKGHKVVPYCYRCGTALSSHEVAQGYQKIKDNSVYVKFKVKQNGESLDNRTYFFVWTTTPWTLPGNVALAVGEKIKYIEIRYGKEKLILARDLANKIIPEDDYELISEFDGKDLLGKEYEPLYEINDTDKKAYYVISGDFVTIEDGTGIVHIAPAFGEDDANVGRENKLPTLLTVNDRGEVDADVPGKGIPVKKKNDKNRFEVDDLIIKDLDERKLLFKEESYEHDYPFCWRCDTPLIYYAKPSWFIRMSELSKELVKNNEKINWVPEHIKEGRFGEWLRGVKDWAISRERYWGTPLPIWECECGETRIIESMDELKEGFGNKNKLFLMRHGQANNNVEKILMAHPKPGENPLTKEGKEQVKKIAGNLKDEKIEIIFSSPIQRTRETAEIIAEEIGAKVIPDERLREVELGSYEGKTWKEFLDLYPQELNPGSTDKNGIEGLDEMRSRLNLFLNEINEKYQGKNIVVVSHGGTIKALQGMLRNMDARETLNIPMLRNGEIARLYSAPIDLHKPYIDDIKFKCSCGKEMKRVSEVMDVWFDSGSMPLAQWHYPNDVSKEIRKKIESGKYYPADFICEAIDQTRGWFYTLHAISTLLHIDKKVPSGNCFKNVICLGHILDAKGKKMSKSKGNIVEPMEIMNEYGADMLRWMLYTINQPGLPKRFDIKGMKDIMNRVFRMLWNSYYFFVMYANIDKFAPNEKKPEPKNLLDKWIISELQTLIKTVDEKLEKYDVYGAAKPIESFVDNLSNWYIRRSRKRFWKSENDTDKNQAYETLHYVLVTLSKLMAPFTPFIADEIYKNLTGKESVHLSEFPVPDEKLVDEKLNEEMSKVRNIISEGLQIRAQAKVKVRQPLQKVSIKYTVSKKELNEIIKEELNVKEILVDKKQEETIILDTKITDDLRLEGVAREIIRYIQEMRKEAGFEVDNRIEIGYISQSPVFSKFRELIAKETLANSISEGKIESFDINKAFEINDEQFEISLRRE